MRCERTHSSRNHMVMSDTTGERMRRVLDSIAAVVAEKGLSASPRLVAVTKTVSPAAIVEAYAAGQRHFGENYVKELYDKSRHEEIVRSCPDIEWHMIGRVQTKKVNKLLSVERLRWVQTIDSSRLAEALNGALDRTDGGRPRLKVMVQVNTSGEESKSGVRPDEARDLVVLIRESCPRLEFAGLMTVESADEPSKDFETLVGLRRTLCDALAVDERDVELSMGMSGDYELAVAMGATTVRVGTSIFGARNYDK